MNWIRYIGIVIEMMINRIPRLIREERVLVPLCALVFALVFSWPLLGHLTARGTSNDWDSLIAINWASRKTILTYHQLPLWNPYRCGGMPQLGNPQSQIISPFFPLSLLFGVFLGTHLQIILCLAVAWSGGYVLARTLGISPLGAAAAAMVFPASSWFYLKVGVGNLYALGATYLPWAYATGWIATKRHSLRYSAAAGAVLALTFLNSGPDALVYGAVGLGALLVAMALIDRSWQPLGILFAICLFTVGFAAIKLVPFYRLLQAHPRPTGSELEANDLKLLLTALFSSSQNLVRGLPNGWGFWEAGAYIGVFALPATLGFAQIRRAAPWIFAGAILILLARGDAEPLAVWPILHKMPVFDSVRLPSRFLVPFTLVVGVMTGFGTDWLTARWRPWGAIAGSVMIVVATVNCLLVGPPNLVSALQQPATPAPPGAEFHQILYGPGNNSMLIPAMENLGVVACYDYTDWSTNARASGQPGYRGEQYLLGPGSLGLVRWTPNALTYDVDVPSPTEIVVNQNYDRWWRVVEGRGTIVNERGLIGIRVSAGSQQIEIAYRDYGALLGALITLATIAAVMMLWRRERQESTEEASFTRESSE